MDSWCKPYMTARGVRVSGGAAREARIADQGGMDNITSKREMRGFKSGYDAGAEDMAERLHELEARVGQLERRRATT